MQKTSVTADQLSPSRLSLVEELAHSYRKTNQMLFKVVSQMSHQAGDALPVAECLLLFVLQHHGALTQKAIARELHHSEAAVSRQVALAVESGTVFSQIDPEDRRSTIVSLTAKGFEIVERVSHQLLQHLASCLEDLPDETLQYFIEANQLLQQALESTSRSIK